MNVVLFSWYVSHERSPQWPRVLFVFSFYCLYSSQNGLVNFIGFSFSQSHSEKIVLGGCLPVLESVTSEFKSGCKTLGKLLTFLRTGISHGSLPIIPPWWRFLENDRGMCLPHLAWCMLPNDI